MRYFLLLLFVSVTAMAQFTTDSTSRFDKSSLTRDTTAKKTKIAIAANKPTVKQKKIRESEIKHTQTFYMASLAGAIPLSLMGARLGGRLKKASATEKTFAREGFFIDAAIGATAGIAFNRNKIEDDNDSWLLKAIAGSAAGSLLSYFFAKQDPFFIFSAYLQTPGLANTALNIH